jgi:hypothetical protein
MIIIIANLPFSEIFSPGSIQTITVVNQEKVGEEMLSNQVLQMKKTSGEASYRMGRY